MTKRDPINVVAISDTHNQHGKIKLPQGDLLVHAGDFSNEGSYKETVDFLDWFSRKSADFKHGGVFISGNHDSLDEENPAMMKSLVQDRKHIQYLNNSGLVIADRVIWGSPTTPKFGGWSYMPPLAERIRHWSLIPQETDLLIVHGPAHQMLDLCDDGRRVGCPHLLSAILSRIVKKMVCGHIHYSHGKTSFEHTDYYNAAQLNEAYQVAHPPLQFVLD
jgi:3',5'-cyclic AMP phosphodiesterase CpdA